MASRRSVVSRGMMSNAQDKLTHLLSAIICAVSVSLYVSTVWLFHDAYFAYISRLSDSLNSEVWPVVSSGGMWKAVWWGQYFGSSGFVFGSAAFMFKKNILGIACISLAVLFLVWSGMWILYSFVYDAYAVIGEIRS